MKNPNQLEGKVPAQFVPQKYPTGEMSGEVDYTEGADITLQHSAVGREHPEPMLAGRSDETVKTFPLWLIILSAGTVFWAGGYLLLFSGAFRSDVYNERRWEPAMFFPAAEGGPGAAIVDNVRDPKKLGEVFFKQNCVACHQATGQGSAGAYPSLVGSEWVVGNDKRLAGILLHGLTGPITVHGETASYSGVMQAWGGTLTNDKIAFILTYIRQAWGNQAPPVTPEQIAAAREAFGARSQPWTQEELLQIPESDTLPGGAGEEAPPAEPGKS